VADSTGIGIDVRSVRYDARARGGPEGIIDKLNAEVVRILKLVFPPKTGLNSISLKRRLL